MEIQLYNQIQNPVEAADKLGVMIAKSGFAGVDNIAAGQVIALVCMCERISPTQFFRTYDIIGGKPRKKAMAAFAEFRGRGGKVEWLATGEDGQKAEAKFTFEGQSITLSFTLEQAKGMGLIRPNSGWTKSPANMLRARVLSNALGMLCPEIFAGDDAPDYDPAPAPEIKLSAPAPSPATPAAPEVVVDAEVMQESPQKPATPPEEPHNAPEPTAAPAPDRNPPAASNFSKYPHGELNADLLGQVEAALHAAAGGDVETINKAVKWLQTQTPPWITVSGGLASLTEKRANQIIGNAKALITKAKAL